MKPESARTFNNKLDFLLLVVLVLTFLELLFVAGDGRNTLNACAFIA